MDGKGNKARQKHGDAVLSYLAVRRSLGVLGLALPFVLILGALALNRPIPPTMSDFYYSETGDIFVGTLAAIGVFLYAYKGYPRRPGERISDLVIARSAGLAAVIVALVPTLPPEQAACSLFQCFLGVRLASAIHLGAAGLFFAMLALFCLVQFPKTAQGRAPTPQKLRRNRIYRACGIVLILAIAGIAIHAMLLPEALRSRLDRFSIVFVLESLGIWAFGISWLVKGQAISLFNDPGPRAHAG